VIVFVSIPPIEEGRPWRDEVDRKSYGSLAIDVGNQLIDEEPSGKVFDIGNF